ncbi:hypothetical protein ACEUZ9_000867 [Paracoccus litorisediminis]|uniref:hypothetical protein n=1 Tax=Paracoccus litorisediminis TaxID=2006130 RepID=UPI00372ECF12
MFRDKILDRAAKAASGGGDAKNHELSLKDARAVRLDAEALRLLRDYLDELPAGEKSRIINVARMPWPQTWIEYADEDGVDIGFMVTQDDGVIRCQTYDQVVLRGTLIPVPPLTTMVIDQRKESFETIASEAMRSLIHSPDTKIQDLVLRSRVLNAENVMLAGALSLLLEARDVLDLEDELPLPRQARRQAEREGREVAKSRVSRIDLGAIGRAEYRARYEPVNDTDGEATTRKRRAHWVRGHLFLARNGSLTYRKPHMRGLGEAVNRPMHVTASTAPEELPAP